MAAGPVGSKECGSYQIPSVATVDPMESTQPAEQSFASGTVNFTGCQDNIVMTPVIRVKSVQTINYTIHKWSIDKQLKDGRGNVISLTTATEIPSSLSAGQSNSPDNSRLVQDVDQPLVVNSPRQVKNLTLSYNILRSPPVDGTLFGVKGEVQFGAPASRQNQGLKVADLKVTLLPPGGTVGEPSRALKQLPVVCPNTSKRNGGGYNLPAAPNVITCTFNYNMTEPAPCLVTGIVSMVQDNKGETFVGPPVEYGFAGGSAANKVVVLGECAVVDAAYGMEEYQEPDRLLPPVRASNELGLPLPQTFQGE
eukprot:gene7597-7802_t